MVSATITEDTLEEHVPVNLIFADDSYSRLLRQPRLNELIASWSREKMGVVYLSLRDDGTYACVDGNHRVAACRTVEGDDAKVPARIYIDLTLEDEARLFTAYNKDRTQPRPYELFRARLRYGEPQAVGIQAMVESAGLAVGGQPGKGLIQAVSALDALYESHGGSMILDVLVTLRRAWGDEQGVFTSETLRGLAAFLSRYREVVDRARLLDILEANGPHRMAVKALEQRAVNRAAAPTATWGRALRDLYNTGLRKNQLPEWTQLVMGESALDRTRPARQESIVKARVARRPQKVLSLE